MKSKTVLSIGFLTGFSLSCISAMAATVEVQWQEPEHYRDMRTTDSGQNRYQAKVMDELETQFRQSAEVLPEGQTLHITVKDVDLAGSIEYFYRNYPFGLRVVRNIDSPAMELSYALVDSTGEIVKSGDDRLVDPGFNFSTLVKMNRSPLYYEKVLIRDWVKATF